MKHRTLFNVLVALGLILALGAGSSLAQETTVAGDMGVQAAVGTAFTYQGQLTQSGNPVTGTCDFQFGLWDAASGGAQVGSTLTKTSVALTSGRFDAALDFGGTAFQGDARYLQIAVRCPAGSGSYTALSGRTALNAAPYALSLRPGASVQSSMSQVLNLSTSATYGSALNANASATSGNAAALYGSCSSPSGAGVSGYSSNGKGVEGSSASGHGVHGKANPPDGWAIYSEGNTFVDGSLQWTPKKGYVSISAAAFQPVNSSYKYSNWGNNLTPTDGSSPYYYAPVQLPHNATVKGLTFNCRDTSANDAECKLFRNNLQGGGAEMARVTTSGTPGLWASEDLTVDNAHVNNTLYAYYVQWYLPDANTSGYGVIIEYTFNEPY